MLQEHGQRRRGDVITCLDFWTVPGCGMLGAGQAARGGWGTGRIAGRSVPGPPPSWPARNLGVGENPPETLLAGGRALAGGWKTAMDCPGCRWWMPSGKGMGKEWERNEKGKPRRPLRAGGCRNGGARGGPAETFHRAQDVSFPSLFPSSPRHLRSAFSHTLIAASSHQAPAWQQFTYLGK